MNETPQESGLQIVLSNGGRPVMRVAGELTSDNCAGFADLVGDALEGPGAALALDFEGLEYVDSSGLRELMKAAGDAGSAGCTLSIISMQPQFDHVLTVTGLKHLFVIDTVVPDEWISEIECPQRRTEHRFSVVSDRAICRDVRDEVYGFAAAMGFEEPQLAEIQMAVGEAISNAVRHGAAPGDTIDLLCRDAGRRIIITLTYPSAVFDPDQVPAPVIDENCEGGMGIYLMRLVMDRVRYDFHDGLVDLTLEKALPEP